jgi:hypothetical protein
MKQQPDHSGQHRQSQNDEQPGPEAHGRTNRPVGSAHGPVFLAGGASRPALVRALQSILLSWLAGRSGDSIMFIPGRDGSQDHGESI